jgi:hypothetical protein
MKARVAHPHGLPGSNGIGVNVPFGCFTGAPPPLPPCALGQAIAHTTANNTTMPILNRSMFFTPFGWWPVALEGGEYRTNVC